MWRMGFIITLPLSNQDLRYLRRERRELAVFRRILLKNISNNITCFRTKALENIAINYLIIFSD